MDKDILAIFNMDESKTLAVIKPLYCSLTFHRTLRLLRLINKKKNVVHEIFLLEKTELREQYAYAFSLLVPGQL